MSTSCFHARTEIGGNREADFPAREGLVHRKGVSKEKGGRRVYEKAYKRVSRRPGES